MDLESVAAVGQARLAENHYLILDVRRAVREMYIRSRQGTVDMEGEVRQRGHPSDLVREQRERVDGRAGEGHGNDMVWVTRMVCRIVPCAVESFAHVCNRAVNTASDTSIAFCPETVRGVYWDYPCDGVAVLVVNSAVDGGGQGSPDAE